MQHNVKGTWEIRFLDYEINMIKDGGGLFCGYECEVDSRTMTIWQLKKYIYNKYALYKLLTHAFLKSSGIENYMLRTSKKIPTCFSSNTQQNVKGTWENQFLDCEMRMCKDGEAL